MFLCHCFIGSYSPYYRGPVRVNIDSDMTFSSISKTTGFEIQTRGILYVTNPPPSPSLRWPHYHNQADLLLHFSPFLLSDTDMLPLPFPLLQQSSEKQECGSICMSQRGLEKEMVLIISKEYEKHNYKNRDVQP